VRGLSSAGNNAGVFGTNDAPDIPNDGFGVVGVSNAGIGSAGFSTSRTGVYGRTGGDNRAAVFGQHIGTTSATGAGVTGHCAAAYGVVGVSFAPHFGGVWAQGPDFGVVGFTGTTLEAPNPDGYSGYFASKVFVNGKLEKNGGGFIIDHPLEPANKYLNHSFVESAEMKNIYDGVVELDEERTAWVELSEYFEALNRDYRYQLTAIGGAAPELHVAEELSDNRFKVAGGKEGMKICWQVTGVRKDRWAEANPMEVEQEKPEENRGRYLHPGLYGEPEERSVARPFLADVAAQEEAQQPPELPSDALTHLEERQQQIEEQRRWIEELRRRMEGQKEPQEEGSS
jgi:hypothetical protein